MKPTTFLKMMAAIATPFNADELVKLNEEGLKVQNITSIGIVLSCGGTECAIVKFDDKIISVPFKFLVKI